MELDARLRERLIGTLRTELPKLGLSEKGRLDIRGLFDVNKAFSAVLRGAPNKLKEQIDAYLDEYPFVSLAGGVLSDELSSISNEEKAGKNRLCDLLQYSDVEALADRLVGLLTALPKQYVAIVELPSDVSNELFASGTPPIIGQRLAVIGAWHEKQDNYPASPTTPSVSQTSNGLLGLTNPLTLASAKMKGATSSPEPPIRNSHLYIRLDGYIHQIYSSAPINRFMTLFKSFFGLGIGMEALDKSWKFLNSDNLSINIYECSTTGFVKISDEMMNQNASSFARKIVVTSQGREHLVQSMRTIVKILDMEETLPQLVLAGRWLFDSRANSDELMGFMQLAICTEVLLGTENGEEGVTAMLANRCAYLIANTAKERDDLIAEFRNIYKVRSKIVHRGLGTLKMNERNQFHRLRVICNRVIQREIQLAVKTETEPDQSKQMAQALRSFKTNKK